MSALFYYLIIKPISLLPFRVLYWFSDFIYLFLYKIFGYRIDVLKTNLHNSFPEKTPEEIKEIQDKFYHHLCDIIVESIKLFSLSKEEAVKRLKVSNPEVPNAFFEQGKSIMVTGSHYANWEYAVIADLLVKHQVTAPYSKLSNAFFEKKMKRSRTRFGIIMFTTKKVKEFFKDPPKMPYLTIFGSDQSPTSSTKAYWTRFLNQDTAVLFGIEKYSKKYNMPLVFGGIRKVKRGFYEFYFETLIEDTASTKHGEISEVLTRRIEKQILENPEYWLWTHKRWKREKPEDVVIPLQSIS